MAAARSSQNPILTLDGISVSFGRMEVLSSLGLCVERGGIHSVIGPNGAGKTVMMNVICGLLRPRAGSVFFDGADITKTPAHKRAGLGIARTFQQAELVGDLSVLENVKLGRHALFSYGLLKGAFYWGAAKRQELSARKFIEEEILDFLELGPHRNQAAASLPYGLQKRVELARALALSPRLALLDEPLAGLGLEEARDMARFISDIAGHPNFDVTFLLVEHHIGAVMDLSNFVSVLDFGSILASGTPEAVRRDPLVARAYMGAPVKAQGLSNGSP